MSSRRFLVRFPKWGAMALASEPVVGRRAWIAATWAGKVAGHFSFSVIGFPVFGLASVPASLVCSAFTLRSSPFVSSGH